MCAMITHLPQALDANQLAAAGLAREGQGTLCLSGQPGTGKSVALMARLSALLQEGRRPYGILVLLPQRAQIERYERLLAGLDGPTRGGADLVTFYGFSRRAVSLFWPLVAKSAGFAQPNREPVFLTLETTQYFMWQVVRPLIEQQGYFSDLSIRRERLLSQLIDNLNKSALVGFPHSDIYARLKSAWTGSAEHLTRYLQAQDCAIRFRNYCLEHGLLDFSLTTEVFCQQVLRHEVFQRYFAARYEHLLVDNVEESVPVAQDMIAWAMKQCQSTVMALDQGAGYRLFLGGDAQGAEKLSRRCERVLEMTKQYQAAPATLGLARRVQSALGIQGVGSVETAAWREAVSGQGGGRYWISMIKWVADEVGKCVAAGERAADMAIIAPYVSEVLRFALEEALRPHGVSVFLLRPSTPLREDPVVKGLLVLALLGHPDWSIDLQGEAYVCNVEDVALALHLALADLDPIRARRLAQEALPPGSNVLGDLSGSGVEASRARLLGQLWEAVGYDVRLRYESLRVWLAQYASGEALPLDIMLSRLFGELLSRPGYGFFGRPDRARPCGRLIESANKFRLALEESGEHLSIGETSRQYVETILAGIASAEYLLDWPTEAPDEAVIVAPAYAYLTRDLHSRYQFWIDLGSDGWWNRPNQPLTNPFVLSRNWQLGQPWRDIEEQQSKKDSLGRVIEGLASRCAKGVYLGFSDLGVDGSEQKGRFQRVLQVAMSRGMPRDG